ncbi:MAG: SCO1664 family protein [Anaerolineae bacterium]
MDSNNSDQESKAISIDDVVEVLTHGTIEADHGLMRWSSNYAFLISVVHKNTSIMAVYKPQKGERPLWDFPDGMLCKREMASFLTSEMLDWTIVPPTVLRYGPHGLGSVQFYVDHDPDMNYFEFDRDKIPQVKRICIFDYLVNNADRKGGHCLVDSKGHVWGIDHGITFHSAPKLRTVIWDFAGEPIDDSTLVDVEKLCHTLNTPSSILRQNLSDLLTEHEINSFRKRTQFILHTKKYPEPGAGGPNFPWPPV